MTSFYESLKTFLVQPNPHFIPPYVPVRPNSPASARQAPALPFLVSPRLRCAAAGGKAALARQLCAKECDSARAKGDEQERSSLSDASLSDCELQRPAVYTSAPRFAFKLSLKIPLPAAKCALAEDCEQSARQDKLARFLPYINRVCQGIYISGCIPAQDVQMLRYFDIRAVLNLCGDVIATPADASLSNFIIRVKDGASEPISAVFYECFTFIHYHKQRGQNVLIHCHQGVSRSSTIVLAYLMLVNDLTFLEAFSHLRTCRSIVTPNSGFICQLVDWWTFRHYNTIAFLRCEAIAKTMQLDLPLDIDKTAEKESAVRDMMDNRLLKCVPPTNQDAVHPAVFRLTFLFQDQAILVFKQVPKPKDDRYVLDSRFIYVVSQFHNVTVLMVGKDVPGSVRNTALDAFSLSASSQIDQIVFDEEVAHVNDSRGLLKYCLRNPVCATELFEFADGNLLLSIVSQLSSVDILYTLRRSLARYLMIMIFFERFSDTLVVFYQDYIVEKMARGTVSKLFLHLCDCLGWCSVGQANKFSFTSQRYKVDNFDIYDGLSVDQMAWEINAANDAEAGVFYQVII